MRDIRDQSHSNFSEEPLLENGVLLNQHSKLTEPFTLITTSVLSSLLVLYIIQPEKARKKFINTGRRYNYSRSTVLPGFGILGDRINEFIEIFLDALAIYVHK